MFNQTKKTIEKIQLVIGTSLLALLMGASNHVNAADFTITFPDGVACQGFDLTVNIDFNDRRVYKEFTDENGQPVRIIGAGKGDDLEFVNELTGTTYSIAGNGSVDHTTLNPDGTQSVSTEGHYVFVIFSTDVWDPEGPSTIQYIGRVLYTVDENDVFYLEKFVGRTVDICDALTF